MISSYKGHIFKLILAIYCLVGIRPLFAQPISLSAGKMKSIQIDGHSAQLLKGNVQFEQQGSRVYCDEAEYDPISETLKGMGNVRIVNSEGSVVTGLILNFDNKNHTARVEGNVKLTDNSMVLTTPWIQYNTTTRLGWYGAGGNIVDKSTKLSSLSGTYNPNTKTLFFKKNVILQNPDYIIKTDTLQYHTDTKVARFFSYTQIDYDNQTLVFEKGNYNTEKEIGNFYSKVGVFDIGKILICDTLLVQKKNRSGQAFGKVWMIDSQEHWQIWGQKATFTKFNNELTITGNPMALQAEKNDSFFIKADTLYYNKDSATRIQNIQAIGTMRFMRGRSFGLSKLMNYSSKDSAFKLRGLPVLWDSLTRMSGDSINLFMKNDKLNRSTIYKNAFICIKEDSKRFSQVSGDSMTHLLDKNQKLTQTLVNRNGKSLYYLRENDSINSVFDVTCKDIRFNFENGKISKVYFFVEPEGQIYPLDQFPADKSKLKGFVWDIENRPNRSYFKSGFTIAIPKVAYGFSNRKFFTSEKKKKQKDKK